MRESKTTQIGEFSYSVTQLGATTGRRVFVRMAKLFGAGVTGKDPIAGMLAALNDEDVGFLCDEFAKVTTVKLSEKQSPLLSAVFEEHFAGKYLEMLKWLGFCVEVNFGSFLEELGLTPEKIAQAGSKAASQLKSQTALTSPSGDLSGSSGLA